MSGDGDELEWAFGCVVRRSSGRVSMRGLV